MDEVKLPSKEELVEIFNSSRTVSEAAIKTGLSRRTFETLSRKLGVYRPLRGRLKTRIQICDVLSGKHPDYPTSHLAKRLVEEGVKEYKCESCGIFEWNKTHISLELDHIDGCSSNHNLENLRLLCPNCHSQTPTYRSKKLKWKVG